MNKQYLQRRAVPACVLFLLGSLVHTVAAVGAVVYVDDSASGVADGSDWCNAYVTLQEALSAAALSAGTITEIRVAQGLYVPDRGTGQTPGLRTSTFQLLNGVSILGGFAGFGASDPDVREIDAFRTVLSGDLAGDDVGNRFDVSRYENAYHVVTASTTDATTILDGVSITAGRADGSTPNDSGSGIYNVAGSPTLIDCALYGNWSLLYGGAIYNTNAASPRIERCQIFDNSGDYGGAICNDDHSSPLIDGCLVMQNYVGYYGGGIYNRNQSAPTISDCIVLDNEAFYQGGGVANFQNSDPVIRDCLFDRNSARNGVGGGLYNEQSSPTLIAVTIIKNHASLSGGGIYNSVSNPILIDCQFTANDARNGAAMLNLQSSSTMHNCLFEKNHALMDGGAIYNLGAPGVTLDNCTLVRNVAVRNAGGMYNVSSDPVVRNSILWENQDAAGMVVSSQIQGGAPSIDFSCVQGYDVSTGTGNIHDDPQFIPGPAGCAYLSQIHSGNAIDSPCVDTGGDQAVDMELQDQTTRTDEAVDTHIVDMGYHYSVTGKSCVLDQFQCEQVADLRQAASFAACFTGSVQLTDPCCAAWDLDDNGMIDLVDYEAMRVQLLGPS